MKLLLAGITTIFTVALLAPSALADPPRHMHPYLPAFAHRHQRVTTVSVVPQDIRDHAEMKRLLALYGNPWNHTQASFNWTDAGIGAGTTAGTLLLLAAAAALTTRRRPRLAN